MSRIVEVLIRDDWRALCHSNPYYNNRGQLRFKLAQRYSMPCWKIRAIVEGMSAEDAERHHDRVVAEQERQDKAEVIHIRQELNHHARYMRWLGHQIQTDIDP